MKRFFLKPTNYTPLIGFILIIYIFKKINIGKFISILQSSDTSYISVSFLICPVLIIFFMTLRWYYIVRIIGVKYDFIASCSSLVKSILWGELTPGKLGELIRTKFLTEKTECSTGKAFFAVISDRIYDVISLFFFIIMSCFIFFKLLMYNISFLIIILITILLFFLVLLFISKEKVVRYLFQKLLIIFISDKNLLKIKLQIEEFYSGLTIFKIKNHITCMLISVFVWIFKFITLLFLSKSLNINVSFIQIISIGALGIFTGLLPISIFGIGTRDIVFIYLFSLYGVQAESAIALSFIFLIWGFWSVLFSAVLIYVYEFFKTFYQLINKQRIS